MAFGMIARGFCRRLLSGMARHRGGALIAPTGQSWSPGFGSSASEIGGWRSNEFVVEPWQVFGGGEDYGSGEMGYVGRFQGA